MLLHDALELGILRIFQQAPHYRGYGICTLYAGDKAVFTAVHGSDTWWEAGSFGELCALIDAALDA